MGKMKYLLKYILFVVLISSCEKGMVPEPEPEIDCDWKIYFSRFERIIYDSDTTSLLYKQDIIRIRYDRIFSQLSGKDCPSNLPTKRCVSGDFYVYNLINDTVLIWLSYTQSNWIGKLDKFTVLPLDSVVLINDPDICDKNTPGFRFFY
jgi:hypothetical protein